MRSQLKNHYVPNRPNSYFWALCFLIATFLGIQSVAFAQVHKHSFGSLEIALEILDSNVEIEISASPTVTGLPRTVYDTTSTGLHDWNWLVEIGGISGGGFTFDRLGLDTLYAITFDVLGGDSFTYEYYACGSAPFDDFYCPNGNASANDLGFIYENGAMRAFIDLLDQADYLEDQLGSDNPDNWVVPLDLVEYCDGATGADLTACHDDKTDVSFFVTPQTGTSYGTYGDLLIESTQDWTFSDIQLRFAADKQLTVEGTLALEDVTLTASGSVWGGIVYDSANNTKVNSMTDSRVEKVDDDDLDVGSNPAMITNNGGTLNLLRTTVMHDTQSTWWGIFLSSGGGDLNITDSYVYSLWGHGILNQGNNEVDVTNTNFYQQGSGFAALATSAGGDFLVTKSDFGGPASGQHGQAIRMYGSGSVATAEGTGSSVNRFCGTHDYILYADSNAEIYANDQEWAFTTGHIYEAGGGTIEDDDRVSINHSDCDLGVPASKRVVLPAVAAQAQDDERYASRSYQLMRAGKQAMHSGLYAKGQALLIQALSVNDYDPAVRVAMAGLSIGYKHTKDQAAVDAIQEMRSFPQFAAQAFRDLVVMGVRDKRIGEATSLLAHMSADHRLSPELFAARLEIAFANWREGANNGQVRSLLAAAVPRSNDQEWHLATAYRAVGIAVPPGLLGRLDNPPAARVVETERTILTSWAYPNPFNPTTLLSVDLPESEVTTVKVYDILGREVAVLADGFLDAGTHEIRFDATGLPSGVYIYQIVSGVQRVGGTLNLVR